MIDYNIQLTHRAKDDIINIGDYITYQLLEPETSRFFTKGLRQAIKSLEKLPARWPFVQGKMLGVQRIHCMPYKNYYILYKIEETANTVYILRIGYHRKNWKEILNLKL